MARKPKGPDLVAADRVAAAVVAGQTTGQYVAGLDTASNRLHMYCDNGLQSSCICADKMLEDDRRHMLYNRAKGMFSILPRRTLLVVEEPLALQNGKTTRLLGMAAGAIWAAHLDYEVFWVWVNVSTWKKEVVGKGNATKPEIAAWVYENHHIEFPEEDFYDAFCIALWGRQALERMAT